MNAFLQKLQKWKINAERSSIHSILMNRQLLQFAALVSRKIARYPTRRVSSIFNTRDRNPLLFLFASFNYFHVKLTWFHSSTGCSLSLFLSIFLRYSWASIARVEIQWKATLHVSLRNAESLRLTASRNFIRTNRFGSRITRRAATMLHRARNPKVCSKCQISERKTIFNKAGTHRGQYLESCAKIAPMNGISLGKKRAETVWISHAVFLWRCVSYDLTVFISLLYDLFQR